MRIAVPREIRPDERRVALAPESVKKLVKAGISVAIEHDAGVGSYYSDDEYIAAGANVVAEAGALLAEADFVLKVQGPQFDEANDRHETDLLRSGVKLLASLKPTVNLDTVKRLLQRGVTAFSTDAIPRTTRAQSMDVLSSMANIAGYRAVLIAANELCRYFPMFMTAAGTVFPAKVFVIGAGVAGLQAIATARRLGANVEATDTRPVVREQVESVGGKFVGVETSETAQDAGGYAKELSADFYKKQGELIGERCAAADAVITTALIGGVKAPRLITADMVRKMKPGSVIVDLAAEAGGNCELTEPGKTVERHGVRICGPLNLPSEMSMHGSMLYGRNLTTFILEFWKDGAFKLDLQDEIIKGALITHAGQVMHGPTKDALEKSKGTA
ncbi:MAG: Re/Si-specific NAD(P)(+) transhydrogenase subunit alpha [Phycisphaerales bacterium]|nr:Re/Si-specific NAD(P)(+) transhydrogenase subunit alpha [Phycisphaerales bacterium]